MTEVLLHEKLPAIESLEELASLPQYSVVLVRSTIQTNFRTAWTLSIIDGTRSWHSSSWRAQPTDGELFGSTDEPIILLYKPLEQFGIGTRRDDGWLDIHGNIDAFDTLDAARAKLPAALAANPSAVLAHRIDPGRWQLHDEH
ncbi:hypothetical protein Achl_4301 (plasmid) [Pseudarthrobacter chlorophenolicus A6]|uniref:Uncharacterized protein n=1 Tax=Pseudarthrobacter chlorophenolicus (strain ATCC 700700 / DSM 12829 / CIP 107037 / JCM 12360 / KCTC 9906 / NCIMB 13794 / A6) TaxID=452863 RepID=B8HIK5_PSECP|nr:hypothetical protein [Pseudarthrobacter chlorophenolicus]ACL42252.1 hypothetical protein Achl_4301 [Pseudarthrobacter chlorophenolicus A6]SDQ15501.1 hypothetical protein SAMN04489738_0359 [Pseudarthrobacter chlorophenolicus]